MSDEAPVLLIVEDDESFSRTLRKSFERRGYTVVSADGLILIVDRRQVRPVR